MLLAATGIQFLVELKDEEARVSANGLRIVVLKVDVNWDGAFCYSSVNLSPFPYGKGDLDQQGIEAIKGSDWANQSPYFNELLKAR